MDPSFASDATGDNKSELKNQELVVGAWRFELQTSCAQGRRATRLRYAPTGNAY
jgi:hypothetical protein